MNAETNSESKKPGQRLPTGLLVIVVVAVFFGLAMAMLILSNNPQALTQINAPAANAGPVTRFRAGEPAPDFTLKTLDGKAVTLSQLKGKRVLVNFWASWCAPCLEEIPALKAAYVDLRKGSPDVEFVGIGYQDKTENLKKFAEVNQMQYVVVEDPDGKVGDAYHVLGMPTSIFVDSSGIAQHVETGILTKETVLTQFEKMK